MFQIWTFLLGHTAGYRQSWVAHCKLLLSHSLGALVWCSAVGTGWDEGGFAPIFWQISEPYINLVGQIMPTKLLLAHPDFQNFLRPCGGAGWW